MVPSDQAEVFGSIAEIRTAVLDGNSYYFLRLEGMETFYAINAAENPLAVILNVGDEVTILYDTGAESSILTGTAVTRAGDAPVSFTPEEETETPSSETASQPVEEYATDTPAA